MSLSTPSVETCATCDHVSAALESVVALLARGAIGEQAPAVRPLEEAPIVHRELEERQAPTKAVLALD
jgi:hypothetical protein